MIREFGSCGQVELPDSAVICGKLRNSRYRVKPGQVGVVSVKDILCLYYPGVVLAPSSVGYRMGAITAGLCKETFHNKGSARVFEIGTGCGVIMASTFKNYCERGGYENMSYIAGDVDGNALSVAENTMKLNGMADGSFSLRKGSLFESLHGEKVDVIVSAPPFYSTNYASKRSDIGPFVALDGGDDGLDFYRAILTHAHKHLLPGGKVLLQIPHFFADIVMALAQRYFGHIASDIRFVRNSENIYALLIDTHDEARVEEYRRFFIRSVLEAIEEE